ncbi:uncharacterized protein LOC107807796 [Nicotiana tabacum]|uniref:Uncharacterized protein LOC107807796 n=2 Tax=Nicotiana TaxID=4085 RepID=A0A1S4BFR2_TOBAC|nr:PREDICTED: uncharacterized protein LOC104243675 [Nicotiana sylvestris]XP_016487717.1 PREDICTED: uncharacterized protein LOC107807796 [Nicotiana tabacum]
MTGMEATELMSHQSFSIKKMYHRMRGEFPKVPWKRLTCNNYAVPRWSFIINLAIQGKLHTKDKVAGWGKAIDQKCKLCNEENETIPHLFFECGMSKEILGRLLKWQGFQRSVLKWDEEIEWTVQEINGKKVIAEVYKMTLAGYVYYIWLERNTTLFQDKKKTVDGIFRVIVQDVFYRGNKKSKVANKLKELDSYPQAVKVEDR